MSRFSLGVPVWISTLTCVILHVTVTVSNCKNSVKNKKGKCRQSRILSLAPCQNFVFKSLWEGASHHDTAANKRVAKGGLGATRMNDSITYIPIGTLCSPLPSLMGGIYGREQGLGPLQPVRPVSGMYTVNPLIMNNPYDFYGKRGFNQIAVPCRRRKTADLNPSERWNCPGGCGKMYVKTSSRSIRKHMQVCPCIDMSKELITEDNRWHCPYKCGQSYATGSTRAIDRHLSTCNCRPGTPRYLCSQDTTWEQTDNNPQTATSSVAGSQHGPTPATETTDLAEASGDGAVVSRGTVGRDDKLEYCSKNTDPTTLDCVKAEKCSREADSSIPCKPSFENMLDKVSCVALAPKSTKKRKSHVLQECEKWYCVYGCEKFYRRTSTLSIHKHMRQCPQMSLPILQQYATGMSPLALGASVGEPHCLQLGPSRADNCFPVAHHVHGTLSGYYPNQALPVQHHHPIYELPLLGLNSQFVDGTLGELMILKRLLKQSRSPI